MRHQKKLSFLITFAMIFTMMIMPAMALPNPNVISGLTATCSAGTVTVNGTLGTIAGQQVTITVYPEGSANDILYADQASTELNGAFSFVFKLSQATNGLNYTASLNGDGATVTTKDFIYSAIAPPSGGGGGGGGGSTPPVSNIIIVDSSKVIAQTVTENGQKVDIFDVSNAAKDAITSALTSRKTTVELNLNTTVGNNTRVVISPEVLNTAKSLNVQISTANAKLDLPKELVQALAQTGQALTINVSSGSASNVQSSMSKVKGAEGATVLGTPTQINTVIKGNTKVTIPLQGITIPQDANARKAFLDSLAVFAIHSDGEKKVITGTIVYDTQGNPTDISFHVDKFSTFAVIKLGQPAEFTDIAGHWAEANIKTLVNSGAIAGYFDKTFKPQNTITRAEFATVLVKAYNLPIQKDAKNFTDTTNHWAKDYIASAYAAGIIKGYSETTFGAEDKITREQMALMISKAANLSVVTGAKVFADQDKISTWAINAVATTTAQQIINGYPDNTFRPQGNATRAEAVTVIVKSLK